ncbi:MAG: hypothetical protein HFI33_05060 [Lachnospiraceae bacterium]|nr:hypothetical protein [Lachnospiraceae bacterium]
MTERRCMMRYVSNAGMVLVAEGQAIGIDVFSRDPSRLYPDTPPGIRQELLDEIEQGNLKTLIFTHGHGDHFCREDVEEALERNPRLQVISTVPVIQELLSAGKEKGLPGEGSLPLGGYHLQAITREKTAQGPFWMQLGAFRTGFLHTIHEGVPYAQVPNLTLLMEVAGQRWVVAGDAAPRGELFAQIACWKKELDWFFLPFPYVGVSSTRCLLKKMLDIRQSFVLHEPRREADHQNWRENTRRICMQARDGLPLPVFAEEPGSWYRL